MGDWNDGAHSGRQESVFTLLSPTADADLISAARARLDERSRRRRAGAKTRMERTLTGINAAQTERISSLWDRTREDARHEAARLTTLASSVARADDPDADPDRRQAALLQVAAAMRCTRQQAEAAVHRAHHAVENLPCTLEHLSNGELPTSWFDRLVRATRPLEDAAAQEVDAAIAASDLEVTPESFARRLNLVVAQVRARTELPACYRPEARRRVELDDPRPDGTGCLRIIGPIPEILGLARRLDSAAHAVQHAQRLALQDGTEVPVDPRGEVATYEELPTLAQLRYDLLCGAVLDTGAVTVPPVRFRMNVTVPALTLLGESDAPGLLDGRHPIPAEMARELAGTEETWFRVLTDPGSGEFLRLPADRYRPTPAMLEHLRLRHPECAAPGCSRPTNSPVECDHIEEFDHEDPAAGGSTTVENLQLLCRQHHRLKTAGLLDPIRDEEDSCTIWGLPDLAIALQEDAKDLATEQVVCEMEEAWAAFLAADQARRDAAKRRAQLQAGEIVEGEGVIGPGGEPGWTVRADGTLRPPLPEAPPPPF